MSYLVQDIYSHNYTTLKDSSLQIYDTTATCFSYSDHLDGGIYQMKKIFLLIMLQM
jgi:hypothetical protein